MNTKLGRPRQGESVKRSTSVRISDEDRARIVFEHGSLQKFLDKSIKYSSILSDDRTYEDFEEWCHSMGFEDARVCKTDMVSSTVLKDCFDHQQRRIDDLREDLERLNDVEAWFKFLAHGDKKHRDWLKKAIIAFINKQEKPEEE